MSNYFRALNRLQRTGGNTAAVNPPAESDMVLRSSEEELPDDGSPRGRATSTAWSVESSHFREILDVIRSEQQSERTPVMAIASATGVEPIYGVVEGLSLEASRLGLSIVLGELVVSAEGRRVRPYSRQREILPEDASVQSMMDVPVTLSGQDGDQHLKQWFARAGSGSDLMVVIAPPAIDSMDCALLGRAGDGLILVTELLVTRRAELRDVVHRVRRTGCRLTGIVVTGSSSPLPRPLEALLSWLP